jgi:hypothetical protein
MANSPTKQRVCGWRESSKVVLSARGALEGLLRESALKNLHPQIEPILYWRFLFVIEETARDGLAANCVQMYVAAPPLERAGVSGCPAQPACATLPTRVRGTR